MNPIVIGGGMAGLAAACRLAGDGQPPLVLERAPRLGGRAASFSDPFAGYDVDYGHHVLLRCCDATQGFLRRIGQEDSMLFPHALSIPLIHRGQRSVLRSRPLPGRLHLLPTLLRDIPLAPFHRWSALRAASALWLASPNALQNVSFRTWLSDRRQTPETMRRFWEPIVIATLNAPLDRVNAEAARKVFVEGFSARRQAGMGFFRVPLSTIWRAAEEYITARDGAVLRSAEAQEIVVQAGRVRGVKLKDGRTLDTESVICATPPWDLARLLPSEAEQAVSLPLSLELSWSPIINVHLWFDRPVLADPFFVALEAPIQAAFDVTALQERHEPAGRTHIVISQSAADAWQGDSDSMIVDRCLRALHDAAPRSHQAAMLRSRVIRHPRATFVASPGSDRLRPPSTTCIRGLFLAGDWTSTGWPSTLEGAVLSGIRAAARWATQQEEPACELSS